MYSDHGLVLAIVQLLSQRKEIFGSLESKECWYGGNPHRILWFISMSLVEFNNVVGGEWNMEGC